MRLHVLLTFPCDVLLILFMILAPNAKEIALISRIFSLLNASYSNSVLTSAPFLVFTNHIFIIFVV